MHIPLGVVALSRQRLANTVLTADTCSVKRRLWSLDQQKHFGERSLRTPAILRAERCNHKNLPEL
ncbi:hypothetical protein B2G74_22175 [Burkholderia sp. A27]|nr:hypothetical protein B2G74_22175 [Burkholderia sp. A27]